MPQKSSRRLTASRPRSDAERVLQELYLDVDGLDGLLVELVNVRLSAIVAESFFFAVAATSFTSIIRLGTVESRLIVATVAHRCARVRRRCVA